MNPTTALTPHVLLAPHPEAPGYVALQDRTWHLDSQEDAAFVFPTLRLAQRYAEYFKTACAAILEARAAPGRTATLPLRASCVFCGCVHSFACPHGCTWAHPDTIGGVTDVRVCSACVSSIRAELTAELSQQPDDPSQGDGLSLGEARGLNYGSAAFNAEMARSGGRLRAEHLSRVVADVVHAIACDVEGAR